MFFHQCGAVEIPKNGLHDDYEKQISLANGVEEWINRSLNQNDFKTSSALFNGEWLFGTYMMSGMGFGQMAFSHPDKKSYYLTQMEKCIDKLLSDEVRSFDINSWGEDPLSILTESESSADLNSGALSYLVGTPHKKNNFLQYLTGGPLGTAIMFAVLTALPEKDLQNL